MACVLGIDAGGSKTVALLADEHGQVLAETRRGGANLSLHGELAVEKVLHDVLEALAEHERPRALCVGMAGIEHAGGHETMLAVLRRLGVRVPVRIVHDAAIALVAGAPQGVGIVLLSGTGSIAYGVDARATSTRAGGWGPFLGDEGSAYWLGQEALRRVMRAGDGRGPATRLHELLLAALGLATFEQLVPRVYEQGLERHEVAALLPQVGAAARQGDAVACGLLTQAADYLALAVRAVAHRLDFAGQPFPVVLAGGTFVGCPELLALVVGALALPQAQPTPLTVEPAQGAVRLALGLLQ